MRAILLAAACVLFAGSCLAQAPRPAQNTGVIFIQPKKVDRKMSDAQSDVLARALVKANIEKGVKNPGFSLDGAPSKPEYPHIEFFDAYSSVGQGIFGSYALDLYTADAWDMTRCKEIRSRKLEGLQRRIRRELGLTERRYRQIRSPSPPCVP